MYCFVLIQTPFRSIPFVTHCTQIRSWLVIMWMLSDIITISFNLHLKCTFTCTPSKHITQRVPNSEKSLCQNYENQTDLCQQTLGKLMNIFADYKKTSNMHALIFFDISALHHFYTVSNKTWISVKHDQQKCCKIC